jgi:hypothetical protein
MPNFIRTKQIDQTDLSGFFIDSIATQSGRLLEYISGVTLNETVLLTGNQRISGVKTFANNLNVSGDLTVAGTLRYNEIIDTTVTGNLSGYTGVFQQVYANNLVYNTGNQNISGQKRFTDQDIVSTVTFNSPNQPSTFIGGFSGPGVFRFEVKPEYRPVVFPNPNYFYSGVNVGQPVEIYFNTGTSRWWYTVNNSFVDASPIVQASNYSAPLPLNNWSGGNMRIYPTYSHNTSHHANGNDAINPILIDAIATTGGNQTISGVKTFSDDLNISGDLTLNGGLYINDIEELNLIGANIYADNLVYNTGDQTISGDKSFVNKIYLNNENDGGYGGTSLEGNISGIKLTTFQQPTHIKIRNGFQGGQTDQVISVNCYNCTDSLFGTSINTNGEGDAIVIYQTGSSYGTISSKGPYIRLGENNIISEKSTSKLGIGALFPTEKVHISGGNLKVEGNAIANNLVYNTGNQTISGVKTFATGIIAPNLIYNTGNQTISGVKTFATGIFAPNLVYTSGDQTISGNLKVQSSLALETFNYPPANKTEIVTQNITDTGNLVKEVMSIGMNYAVETESLFGQDKNTFGLGGDKVVFYQTGRSNGIGFSVGPYLRLGYHNIISEKSTSFLGIGTLFPNEKVHISGGNLKVEGTAIANNLIYNTGNQTISGVKTFANAISGNFQVSGTGIFNAIDLNSVDIISLSGVDVTITSGLVVLTNPVSAPNLVYNTGNQNISGVKTFNNSGIFTSGLDLNNSNLINATPQLINETTNFIISGNDNGRVILANHSTNEITGRIVSGNPIGFNTSIIQINSGIFITGSGNGITINSFGGYYRTAGKFATVSLLHTGNNGYIMYGNTI